MQFVIITTVFLGQTQPFTLHRERGMGGGGGLWQEGGGGGGAEEVEVYYIVCVGLWCLGRTTVGCGLFVPQSAHCGSSLEVESASN